MKLSREAAKGSQTAANERECSMASQRTSTGSKFMAWLAFLRLRRADKARARDYLDDTMPMFGLF